MKKFWKKYKVVIIVVLSIVAFIALSILVDISKLYNFKKNFKKDEYAVTVIALTTCPHCHNFKPIIKDITEEYNLPLYWIEFDSLSNKDRNYLNSIFADNGYEGYSPYIAVSKKGKVINNYTGEMEKEDTLTFLRDSGAIK